MFVLALCAALPLVGWGLWSAAGFAEPRGGGALITQKTAIAAAFEDDTRRPVRNLPPLPDLSALDAMSPDDARALNGATDFAKDFGSVAAPFIITGDGASEERAVDCLATAMLYEAGGDRDGQLAVGQVVLNRVRHPAFPATVCGVVFQGSERATGCQFTFTCDGALTRRMPQSLLDLARQRARAMLWGMVFPGVGVATHYHTDWVHPVWSTKMDKLARVGTHLFFRWPGAWGRADALRRKYVPKEPSIARMASLSRWHAEALAAGSSDGGQTPFAANPSLATLSRPAADPATAPLIVRVAEGFGDGTRQAMAAIGKCSGRAVCRLVGLVGGEAGDVALVYLRDRAAGADRTFWNCTVFPRADKAECLDAGVLRLVGYAPTA